MTTHATRSFHLAIALLVLVLDRVAKWVVARGISLHDTIQMIPGFFRLTHVENRGAAFGFFADSSFGMENYRVGVVLDCGAGDRLGPTLA